MSVLFARKSDGTADFYEPAGVHVPRSLAGALADTVYIGGGTPSLLDPVHLRRMLDVIRAQLRVGLSRSHAGGRSRNHRRGQGFSMGARGNQPGQLWRPVVFRRRVEGHRSHASSRGYLPRRPDLARRGHHEYQFRSDRGLAGTNARELAQTRWTNWRRSARSTCRYTCSKSTKAAISGQRCFAAAQSMAPARYPAKMTWPNSTKLRAGFCNRPATTTMKSPIGARPGFESRHNLKYWRREPYLGFGAGAHSFSGTQRWANAHDAAAYVSAIESGRLPVGATGGRDAGKRTGGRAISGLATAGRNRCRSNRARIRRGGRRRDSND